MRRLGWLLLLAILSASCGGEAASTTQRVSTTTTSTSTSTSLVSTTSSGPAATSTTSQLGDLPDDLLVVGDWGTGTLPQGAVAGAMQRYAESNEVAALLTTGDNFYNDDVDFLMQPYRWVEGAGIPWWITWGNHDVETESRIRAVEQTFDDPPRWTLHEWGRVDVVILDSNQVDSLPQAAFFLNAMGESERPTILVLHHPPYSCTHREDTVRTINQWVSILDEDVVLVLAGHDHSYQRYESDGIQYVVTGGGGAPLHDLQSCPVGHPEQLAGAAIHNFVVLRQIDGAIELSGYDVNGGVIDQILIGFD